MNVMHLTLILIFVFTLSANSILLQCCAFSTIPSSSSHPHFQHPSTAEEAVENQLYYYQTNQLSKAFECCSPANQEATGGLREFERLIQLAPYDLILEHERSDVLLEIKPVDDLSFQDDIGDEEEEEDDDEDRILDVALFLVCIRPNIKARRKYPIWFWWEMSLVPDKDSIIDAITTNSNPTGKWMVDCIIPDFDDLDFETESLSIEDFGDIDDDDDDGDSLTIYLDE